MIGAVEKQKLVYILNRDSAARLTISSPLEAHKSHTLVYHVVGVDVGFENPLFACLELDYEESDNDHTGEAAQVAQQNLTYYELDLGLNHVVRKYSEPLDDMANMLITVPGGTDGPSGVLVCCENYIIYKNFGDQPDIRCPIPRRQNDLDDADRSMLIITSAMHKTKHLFFFLLQSEQGDIFKVMLDVEDDIVVRIKIKYFDTVPVCSSLCVLKSGLLFCSSEFGNHYLYQIAHLGDDSEREFHSDYPLEEGETFFFGPRPLKNLILVDEMESLSPIMSCQIADLANEDTPQLYAACGRGPRSSLRVLRHGLEVTEMAVSELPGNPHAVWTVKKDSKEDFDSYIVVSFMNATLILSIGETVEEVTDSGFLGTTPTLACSQLGDDALIQIYPEGIRHIRSDKRVNEWRSPGKRLIRQCAVNEHQVVIALSGGEIVYFEMDQSGQLNEYTERKEMTAEVICISLGSVPPGQQRCRFLAVGLSDQTVRIISLDPHDTLQPLSMQALPALPESLCIVNMSGNVSDDTTVSTGGLFLNIGLQNGVLLRTALDNVTGDLSDTRTRYLGTRPVKLFRVRIQGTEGVIAVSSRTWLNYTYQSRFHLTPLSYDLLEYASSFTSEQCPEGMVAISSNTLRILALEKLGVVFNQVSTPLQYTPRKLLIHPPMSNLVLIETDHNAFTEATKLHRKKQMAEEMVSSAADDEKAEAAKAAEAFLAEDLPEHMFGSPKAGRGMWASCLRVMHPNQGKTLDIVQFEQNEAAFSLAVCQFVSKGDLEWFVVVGTAKDMIITPRAISSGSLIVFRLSPDGSKLEHVHTTQLDDVPIAMAPFQGRLLVGVGKLLRIYDIGKKKMLRKCENKHLPYLVVDIKVMGRRVYVGDVQEAVHFLYYRPHENQLVIFADEVVPRFCTTSCILDYNTVASADKFGNITILRLPSDVTDQVDEDPSGSRSLWDRGFLNGATQKANVMTSYHVGEGINTLHKVSLIPGGSEVLVYTTLSGSIGILVPFSSKEDSDFFQHLEMHMRSEWSNLVGRDHLSFRSYYVPVKSVIDGDLCEVYNSLDPSKRREIALDLDRSPSEVAKKLEDLRTRYAF
ncbi:PREDICTED: splicing factor 3B subunit 3-like isoform X2 [Amphimedon queenslandica]|nr:PREDICTED: splicing factor 3B subunit 3-like isoform X2 [Amphimedon queenslandica]|eukprot:XP_019849007.1 PREDICTED: splicing factor 3B subunit 3-like isoform X2 [Amphimedon queenslandica]